MDYPILKMCKMLFSQEEEGMKMMVLALGDHAHNDSYSLGSLWLNSVGSQESEKHTSYQICKVGYPKACGWFLGLATETSVI